MSAITWKRRQGGAMKAHAFRDGIGVCRAARLEVGTTTHGLGCAVTPLVDVEAKDLNWHGVPFGHVCTPCLDDVGAELVGRRA